MTDIFSKVAKQAKQAKQVQEIKPAIQTEAKTDNPFDLISNRLQKSIIYAAFYAVYQKSGSLYNQASIEGLLTNVSKALSDEEYADFACNVKVIAEAIAAIQSDIKAPLSADDVIKEALSEAPDESPKEVLNRLIKEKTITGADARRYLERLLGW